MAAEKSEAPNQEVVIIDGDSELRLVDISSPRLPYLRRSE